MQSSNCSIPIDALLDASIRTDRTFIVDKEYGRLLEEVTSNDTIVEVTELQSSSSLKPVSRKEDFLMKMEVESQMRKI